MDKMKGSGKVKCTSCKEPEELEEELEELRQFEKTLSSWLMCLR